MNSPTSKVALLQQLVALARSCSEAGRPGAWTKLLRRAKSIQERLGAVENDFIWRLYKAEFDALLWMANEAMLPATRSNFLDLVSEKADRDLPRSPREAERLEQMFRALGRPSEGRWGSEDVADRGSAKAEASGIALAAARFALSLDPGDFNRALIELDGVAASLPERQANPFLLYGPFFHFQRLLGEPLERAMAPREYNEFINGLLSRTSWEFDSERYVSTTSGYRPWEDPANRARYVNRANGMWFAFNPMYYYIPAGGFRLANPVGPWLTPEYEEKAAARALRHKLAHEERMREIHRPRGRPPSLINKGEPS